MDQEAKTMNGEAKAPEKLKENFTGLLDDYRDLLSIKLTDHTSNGLSVSIIGAVKVVFVLFILLFTGIGLAWWYGEYVGNMKVGFFMVGALYAVLLLILLLSQKALRPRIRNFIIRKIYEQH